VYFIPEFLLELLVERKIIDTEPKCLVFRVAIELVDELSWPIGHEYSLEEGVSGLGHSWGITAEVFETLIQ
jgi:hypothetical protein